MKRILAIILTLAMAVSAMSMTTVFAENKIIDSDSQITNEIKIYTGLSDREFKTSLDGSGTMVFTSNTYLVDKPYLGVWVNNQSEYSGILYIIQTDYRDEETGKDTLVTGIVPVTTNQVGIVNMISAFGADYKDYRYKVCIEGSNNFPVNGEIIVCEADSREDLFADEVSTEYNTFWDINGHWAEEQIKRISDKGIISGYPDGTFKPDAPITRAEFAKIASVAFNLEDKTPLSVFNDLDSNAWYYPYIEKTASYIPKYKLPVDYPTMQPYENNANGGFLPNSEAIRMHIAEALVLIATRQQSIDLPDIETIQHELLVTFNNEAEYENLFVVHGGTVPANVKRMFEYTYLAYKLGIMQGNDRGYFNPYGYVTRAELVTMIDRMLNQKEQPDTTYTTLDKDQPYPHIELWNKDGFITQYNYWYNVDNTTFASVNIDGDLPERIVAYYLAEGGNEAVVVGEALKLYDDNGKLPISIPLLFNDDTDGMLWFDLSYGNKNIITDTYNVAGGEHFADKEIPNAENLSYYYIMNMQVSADMNNIAIRENPNRVIRECMRNLGYDNGNGSITSLTEGLITTAVYTTENNDSYKIELIRPIRQDKTGILIVRSITYISKTS